MNYSLAIDIGASGGRHIVGWREGGEIKTAEIYRFTNGMDSLDGHLVWDVERLFREVKAGIRESLKLYPDIKTLSIDTWGVDYVLMDGEREILPAYAYRDSRVEPAIEAVHSIIPYPELYKITGTQFNSFNTVYQLYADKLAGRLDGATDFLMIPEYLMYKLTGVKKKEYTEASTMGLLNARTRDFDREVFARLGLPEKLISPLSMPGEYVGSLTDEVAREVGGNIDVVFCATHDTGSAVEAIDMETNAPYVSSGTWSLFGVKTPDAITDDKSRDSGYSNEGGVGYNRYLKNITGMWIIQSLRKELCPDTSYSDIAKMASESDYKELFDVNDKSFMAPESMKDAISDYLASRGKNPPSAPADFFNSAYHSLAAGYRDAVSDLENNTGEKYTEIYIVGGGAKNGYLNSLAEQYTGKKIVALPIEATAIGNLKVQLNYIEGLKKYNLERNGVNMNTYEYAKNAYLKYGVDTDRAIEKLLSVPISIHCWQGDDVSGFDTREALSGGIQTTGNYPGKATTPEQLMADLDVAFSLIPGKKKLNLHACYAIIPEGDPAGRDTLRPEHFAPWLKFAKERGMGIDFNPTFFSHPMVKDGLTLSSPDEEVRRYWIAHGKACLKIAEHFACETGESCVINFWIPDGYKDTPADRLGPRKRFMESLDEILSIPYDKSKVYVTLESKVFGIGLESYTVGSAEFTLSYSASRGITPLMDNGHYHPTEVVSDKIPSLLLFNEKIALHITRSIRWDSDHVVALDDETKEIAKEIVRCDALDRVFIALDYFDASINRIAAWTIGTRNLEKALLFALLQPSKTLKAYQDSSDFTRMLALGEELKTFPFGEVWDEYCRRAGAPLGMDWLDTVDKYEKDVLSKR